MSAFRKPPQAPPVFTATPESVMNDTESILAKSKKLTNDIVAQVAEVDASFRNVILPLARDEDEQSLFTPILVFYQHVSTDETLRNASAKAKKLINEVYIEAGMREDVFKLVDASLKRGDKLDAESQRFLGKQHKSYVRNGLSIPAGPKRDRFKEIQKELSDISIAFSRSLSEEDGGNWFTKDQLDGLPSDVLVGLKQDDNKSKYFLTNKYHEQSPALRERSQRFSNPETRSGGFQE